MTIILPKGFKEHYGANVTKMPAILRANAIRKTSPMSVSEFMKARLMYGDKYPALLENYSDTSDLVAYPDDSRNVKFIFTTDKQGKITKAGRNALKLINTREERDNGAVIIGDKYDALKGIEVPANQLGILETGLTRTQILDSKVWRMLARNPNEVPAEIAEDENLLPEYADLIASKRKATGSSEYPIMAVYMDGFGNQAKLRAFCVIWLEYRSCVYGRLGLVSDYGRLVGLAPEAQLKLASWKPTQKKSEDFSIALTDLTQAEEQFKGLAGILQAGQVDKLGSLLTKVRKAYH